jgi:DNA-binding protein YbaB
MVFDQLKKIAELKKLQDSFKKEMMTVEKRGVTVTMNGSLEIEDIKLNPELNINDQQTVLKQCLNEAKGDIQKKLAKIMMGSGLSF